MSSDEQPELIFRPCLDDIASGIDVNGLFRKGIGYIADKATWQERGVCKSIVRPEWEFQFKNSHNNFTYRRIQ